MEEEFELEEELESDLEARTLKEVSSLDLASSDISLGRDRKMKLTATSPI